MSEKSIRLILRVIQWILTAGSIGIYYFLQTEDHTPVKHFVAWCSLMVVFMLLPVFETLRDTEEWRFSWLLAQTAVLCSSALLAGFRTYPILFVALSAKCSTMVSGKRLNIVLSCASIGFVAAMELGLALHFHRLSSPNLSAFVRLISRAEAELAAAGTIWAVGLLGRKMISEQRAREMAESLTKEIQNMTLALERSRIAQDIHDKLGHTLTSLGIQLELTSKLLQKGQVQQSQEALATAQQLSSDSFSELRRAIQAIRDDFDLHDAVISLAEKVQKQQNLKIDLDVDNALLPTPSRHEIFCIVQECLTNIQKHARATEVKITFKNKGDTVQLTIEDNGIGLPAERSHSGFGIKGMTDRAKNLGGRLEIGKAAECGTIVKVTVPA